MIAGMSIYPGFQAVIDRWLEHEVQHGTEIALIVREHGLPTLDI
jgi:hypothetical protein